ncbi:unnamed protein product, partial [Pylaiella littoralis]
SRKQRKLRETAKKGIGESNKLRKNGVSLVEDSPKEREVIMDTFMEGMEVNGCQCVMEAVCKADPKCCINKQFRCTLPSSHTLHSNMEHLMKRLLDGMCDVFAQDS